MRLPRVYMGASIDLLHLNGRFQFWKRVSKGVGWPIPVLETGLKGVGRPKPREERRVERFRVTSSLDRRVREGSDVDVHLESSRPRGVGRRHPAWIVASQRGWTSASISDRRVSEGLDVRLVRVTSHLRGVGRPISSLERRRPRAWTRECSSRKRTSEGLDARLFGGETDVKGMERANVRRGNGRQRDGTRECSSMRRTFNRSGMRFRDREPGVPPLRRRDVRLRAIAFEPILVLGRLVVRQLSSLPFGANSFTGLGEVAGVNDDGRRSRPPQPRAAGESVWAS